MATVLDKLKVSTKFDSNEPDPFWNYVLKKYKFLDVYSQTKFMKDLKDSKGKVSKQQKKEMRHKLDPRIDDLIKNHDYTQIDKDPFLVWYNTKLTELRNELGIPTNIRLYTVGLLRDRYYKIHPNAKPAEVGANDNADQQQKDDSSSSEDNEADD